MTAAINHNQVIETTLLRGKVKLIQPHTGFHASLDTVFLAAGTTVKNGQKLLDIGCGVGSAGLCVLARMPGITLTGIDIQQGLVDLAHQNAVLNSVEDRCRFFQGNINSEKAISDNAFHAAIMNPPYQAGGTHTPSPNRIKAVAHGEDASGADLNDWIKYAHKKLKNGGHLTLIHRADRLDDIILHLTQRRWFGSLIIQPLASFEGEDAKRVIVSARKERYAPLVLKHALIIHDKNKEYTKTAQKILSDAAGLS